MEQTFTDANFETDVLKNEKPVLVDFWAVWCGPCRVMSPIVEELAGELEGKMVVGKMNVDENMKTPQSFNILSIPTFILFKGGQAVETMVGSMDKAVLKAQIEKHL
jgi:thioredoxin 1